MSSPARPVTVEDLIELNKYLVENFGGGTPGVRYEDGLYNAVERPFTSLFGQEQFPSPEEKAASLMESIILNHPFHDGNKRTGLDAGIGLYEELTGIGITVSKQEALRVCKSVMAAKERGLARLSAWFAEKSRRG